MSGLTNNIDFLVHCASHPGFSENQSTTAFFDENMTQILKSLSDGHKLFDNTHGVSSHAAFGLTALIASSRDTTSNHFRPWSTGSSDWRVFGTVKRSVKIVDSNGKPATVVIESDGGRLNFVVESSEGKKKHFSHTVTTTVKEIEEITVNKVKQRGISVWEIAMNVEGTRRNSTVAIYVTSKGQTIVDGMFQRV